MTTADSRYTGHGHNVRGDAFAEAATVLYMYLETLAGTYRQCADRTVDLAGSLFGKRVADVGCGFGTTTLSIAAGMPAEIIAVDKSETQTELFKSIFHGGGALLDVLNRMDTTAVIGEEGHQALLAHLTNMWTEYWASRYGARSPFPHVITADCLTLTADMFSGELDVLIGTHLAHWPINQRRSELIAQGVDAEVAYQQATRETLSALARPLKKGGTLALFEPMNFVGMKDKPELQQELTARTAALCHHVFRAMDEMINTILLREHSITRTLPTSANLFELTEMRRVFAECGLELHEPVDPRESRYHCKTRLDMVETAFATLPMHIASVDLPFEEKLNIARRVRDRALRELPHEAFQKPMQSYGFVFVATKQ